MAEALADQRRLGRVFSYMIVHFSRMADYDRAIEAGQHALAIGRALGDFALGLVANTYLGTTYYLAEYRRAIELLKRGIETLRSDQNDDRSDVLYVLENPLTFTERHRIVALANDQRQVTVYGLPEFADAGGLMSYSFSLIEQHSAAAIFVDKILRGASPGTLPVEQPTRFELVLNVRTAKAQGVKLAVDAASPCRSDDRMKYEQV